MGYRIRILRCILIVGVLFFLFGSCKTGSVKTVHTLNSGFPIQSGKKVMWLAHWGGEGGKGKFINDIARDFSFLNQDIDLDMHYSEQLFPKAQSWDLYEKLCDSIAQMVRKDEWPFDILLCDQARYWNIGNKLKDPNWGKTYLVDFQKEAWFSNAHKPSLLASGNFAAQYGGIIPGPLLEGNTDILYASSVVEDKLGIKVKSVDMNFTDFLGYAKAVQVYNKSHSDKITFFSSQYYHAVKILFNQLLMSDYEKDTFESRQLGLNTFAETYGMLEQLSEADALVQYYPKSDEQRMLREKVVLFEVFPSWIYPLWQQSNPEGCAFVRPTELPSVDNKKSPIYSGGYNAVFVVPKHSKNPELAIRFIKYLATNEIASKWTKYSKSPTGLNVRFSSMEFGNDVFETYYRHINEKYGCNQGEPNISQILLNAPKELTFKYIEVLKGEESVKTAMNNLKSQLR